MLTRYWKYDTIYVEKFHVKLFKSVYIQCKITTILIVGLVLCLDFWIESFQRVEKCQLERGSISKKTQNTEFE